jgi:processive 1,2-diacylglycerol beta-glucosyltransferase
MDWVPRAFRKAYTDSYIKLIEHAPLLWAHLYQRTDRARATSGGDRLRRGIERLNTRAVLREIDAWAPDVIVCTHFLPAELLSRRNRRGRSTTPVFVQVTDFDVHGLWVHSHLTGYCVATDEVAARIAARGVERKVVHVTGLPIAPAFANAPKRKAAIAELGLDAARPIVLMMSGGAGVGDIAAVAESIVKQLPGVQIIALAGKNAALRESLERLAARHVGRVLPMGFTRTIERLTAAADVAVTKPGGLTTAECLAMQLPIIVVSPIPGQEERNADFLLEAGVALKAVDSAALVYKLGALLADRERLADMRRRMERLGRPHAARSVVDIVMRDLDSRRREERGQ